MTDDQEKMQREMTRVRECLADAVQEIEADGGDVRFFTAAALTAAVQLYVEIEGTDGLHKAITGIAKRELIRAGEAGRC